MRSLQDHLLDHAQHTITSGHDWQTVQVDGAAALHQGDAIDYLTDVGLDPILTNPADTDFLNDIPLKLLGSGGYGEVYEIPDTGVAVKKHYPKRYFGGFRNADFGRQAVMRQISNSSILRHLRINLDLEKALEADPNYTTPHYLGHVMIGADPLTARHYTLMSKVDRYMPGSSASSEIRRIADLEEHARLACIVAIKALGKSDLLIDWDLDDGFRSRNTIPTLDEEGNIVLSIIDQQHWLAKDKKLPGEPVRSLRLTDPEAPWIAVDNKQLAHAKAS